MVRKKFENAMGWQNPYGEHAMEIQVCRSAKKRARSLAFPQKAAYIVVVIKIEIKDTDMISERNITIIILRIKNDAAKAIRHT